MSDLLERLRAAGVPIDDFTAGAMKKVDPSDFTDFNLEPFWQDRPVPFLVTDFGATRTISAPHMIATLLHHLEVRKGQNVLLIGSKGGYLAAVIDCIVGEDGTVNIIEPNDAVRIHTQNKLDNFSFTGNIGVVGPTEMESLLEQADRVDRVLITGSIRRIPESIEEMVLDGGFVLGPFGGPVHQRLLKKERQGEEWFDTDLGGVVFGPMDVSETEISPFEPRVLADHIEDALDLVSGMIEIDERTIFKVTNLISSLREMPTDMPILDEDSTEEEILEHPVFDLLMSEMDWLGPLWPLFNEFLSIDLASPGSPEEVGDFVGGHEDLIP
ncbi:MAG: hypothetical protein CMA12_04615 [Euryarchaeota archaeon]|nr:hypothetical protein [Euryarchaeota archaeon]